MLKMDKASVIKALQEIAQILDLQGENPFKVRAYQNAIRSLLNTDEDFEKMIDENRLIEMEGIGESLSDKIKILAKTGTHPVYRELKQAFPQGLLALMEVPGLGSKKIKILFDAFKIDSIDSLKQACLSGKISSIKGFGKKTEQNILKGIEYLESYSQRHLWIDAMQLAEPILQGLRNLKGSTNAEIAGSIRRKCETVGDLDFVAVSADPQAMMDWFTSCPFVELVIAHGFAKSSVRLRGGIQAELRIVPLKQLAFMLLYSTGSKNHNIKLRQLANTQGLSLSEWGLVPERKDVKDPFKKWSGLIAEGDVYRALGMDDIPPELREDMGEIEAAQKGKLPILIEESDIRGAFHIHTAASDGKASLESMVKAAEQLGWDYLGISDHSKSSFQANGLSEEHLLEQVEKIRSWNRSKKSKVYVFAGVECDILLKGQLDYSHDVLEKLDFVIVSIHSSMHLDEATMTKRLMRAIENPYTTMIGHISGRLLLRREPYALNLPKVIDACIANGKIIELNAHPQRLDMDWRFWHKAADKGLLCSINPDAHSPSDLQFVTLGVNCARKGWLSKDQVVNTKSLDEMMKLLKSKNH